jgi:hypothetical protein
MVMNRPPQTRTRTRAPRVTLPECLFVTVQLESGRKIPGKLKTISLTGGLLDLAVCVEERVPFGLTIPIGSTVAQTRAKMLFPMRSATGYLQPFRFVSLRPEQFQVLDREINELRRQGQAAAAAAAAAKHELGVTLPNFLLELL